MHRRCSSSPAPENEKLGVDVSRSHPLPPSGEGSGDVDWREWTSMGDLQWVFSFPLRDGGIDPGEEPPNEDLPNNAERCLSPQGTRRVPGMTEPDCNLGGNLTQAPPPREREAQRGCFSFPPPRHPGRGERRSIGERVRRLTSREQLWSRTPSQHRTCAPEATRDEASTAATATSPFVSFPLRDGGRLGWGRVGAVFTTFMLFMVKRS